jgi:hypothetical protein
LRFWTDEDFPEAMEVAGRITARMEAIGLTDTESRKALRRLEEARLERRIRLVVQIVLVLSAAGAVLLVIRWVRRRRHGLG